MKRYIVVFFASVMPILTLLNIVLMIDQLTHTVGVASSFTGIHVSVINFGVFILATMLCALVSFKYLWMLEELKRKSVR